MRILASWRADASLAVDGLKHPPPSRSAPWSAEDERVLQPAIARLSAIIGHHDRIDQRQWDQMEAALAALRHHVLRRRDACWPALPARAGTRAPIDFTILVGWGAAWHCRRLGTHTDDRSRRARAAAEQVVTAVALALDVAQRDTSRPAHRDQNVSRRLLALRTVLDNRHRVDPANQGLAADIASLAVARVLGTRRMLAGVLLGL